MWLFDYFFYRMYLIYVRLGEKNIPEIYSIGLLTFFQTLNLFILIQLYEIIYGKYYDVFLYIAGVLIVLNYLLYSKEEKIEKLKQKFSSESKRKKIKNGIILIVYISIVLSIFFYNTEIITKINTSK